MKKIMFNDRYGLQQSVIAKRKTMTRRIINGDYEDVKAYHANGGWHFIADTKDGDSVEVKPAYEIGEKVAVAQSYKTIYDKIEEKSGNSKANEWWCELYDSFAMSPAVTPGYNNKMFVIANAMPHRIRITDIKLERLQDISEEDAMREGVFKYDKPPLHHEMDMFAPWPPYIRPYKWDSDNLVYRCNARAAFAYLIDKISGGGTWNRNPWVFAYEFELVR